MTEAEIGRQKQILLRHMPASAVDRVYSYLLRHSVRFHITQERRSKLGDYRCPQKGHDYHEISVNGDLNEYYFLLVLLHEMAHLDNYQKHKNTVKPHGHEWQEAYREELREYVDAFPEEVAALMAKYTRRIPLNGAIGKQIEAQLLRYNPGYDPEKDLLLKDLPLGSLFRVKTKPQLLLRSETKQRTRYRCVDEATGNQYLVAGNAPVTKC